MDVCEDVRDPGLISGSFLVLPRFRLGFFEQSCVVDCDHRLVGEGFQKSDLVVRKWARLNSCDENRANDLAFEMHGHAEATTESSLCRENLIVISRVDEDVADVNYSPRFDSARGHRHAIKRHREVRSEELDAVAAYPTDTGDPDEVTIKD